MTLKDKAIPGKVETTMPGKVKMIMPGKMEITKPEKVEMIMPGKVEMIMPGKMEMTMPAEDKKGAFGRACWLPSLPHLAPFPMYLAPFLIRKFSCLCLLGLGCFHRQCLGHLSPHALVLVAVDSSLATVNVSLATVDFSLATVDFSPAAYARDSSTPQRATPLCLSPELPYASARDSLTPQPGPPPSWYWRVLAS
ncbi:hypothetical protein EV121DRAFT_295476 [Schizophyllum commune]